MGNTYIKDSLVRVSAVFTESGTDTDPSTVKCFYRDPTGAKTTLVYGTDETLVKDATGQYHTDIYVNSAGFWFYRFEASGNLIAAGEASFYVDHSYIV